MSTFIDKKTVRLFIQLTGTYVNLCTFAEHLGLSIKKESALDPKNKQALYRSGFWDKLKKQIDDTVHIAIHTYLTENGLLVPGTPSTNYPGAVFVKMNGPVITVQYPNGKKTSSHRALYAFPELINFIPGEDPEGGEFWEKRNAKPSLNPTTP